MEREGSWARQQLSRAWFEARAARHQLIRAAAELRAPTPLGRRGGIDHLPVAGRSRTPLWSRSAEPAAERRLEAGKVQNLRVAARALHGRRFEAGEIFSFWRHVGRPTRRGGYALGREVREGCLVPSVGGGLCQLSNALYDAALEAGFEIVERHAHSVVVPGSLAERGRDATVFWRYVDLRFTAPAPFGVEVALDATHLEVRLRGRGAAPTRVSLARRPEPTGSCDRCARTGCVSRAPELAAPVGRTAFLLDGVTPEIDDWLSGARRPGDRLLIPCDGQRWRRPRYAWTKAGFSRVDQALALVARRALESRRLGSQGAARQRALLAHDARLAGWVAARLGPEDTHLVVHQHLLPHLHREGALGGRTFDVVMRRWPLRLLQARLDEAARRHPESPTLADFRAPAGLVADEEVALARARRVITPHAAIADAFGPRAVKLAWRVPRGAPARRGDAIVFLGPVVGREGAHALRDAARGLPSPLIVGGRDLEGGFDWGRPVRAPGADPLDGAAVVVAPAWVPRDPSPLLRALGRGVPVIASPACGLRGLEGVTEIAPGDPRALGAAIRAAMDT